MTQFAVDDPPQTRAPVRPDPDKIDGCEVLAAPDPSDRRRFV